MSKNHSFLSFFNKKYSAMQVLVRPERFELSLKVPETFVLSFTLWAYILLYNFFMFFSSVI